MNKRISIVDYDEPDITTSLKVGLEQYNEDDEFAVDTFNDSIAEQLNYKTAYYDLLLLDFKCQKWAALIYTMKLKNR